MSSEFRRSGASWETWFHRRAPPSWFARVARLRSRQEGGRWDHDAIAGLISTYCRRIDEYDVNGVVELFTADCVLDLGPGPRMKVEGREALRKWMSRQLQTFSATSHHASNVEVVGKGQFADVSSNVIAWHRFVALQSEDGILWGRYHDRIVESESRYLFAERKLLVAGEQGLPGNWHSLPRNFEPPAQT